MKDNYQKLFHDYTFKSGVHVKNRLMMAPMTTFSADENDYVSQEELNYYSERANGVGTVITACAYVSKNGKGFDGQMGIDHDGTIEGLSKLADVLHSGGAKGVVQLYHGGRLAVPRLIPNEETVSASSVAPLEDRGFYSIKQAPRALTTEEVYDIITDFGEATRRAIEAGFDGVELHGASGYLIQQFVSPHSNKRKDEFENPLLFSLKLIEEVKKVINEYAEKPFLIGYRFSPEEPETPGITMKETFELIDELIRADIDYLHIATTEAWAKPRRGIVSEKSRTELIAEYINQRVPLIGVGSIHTPDDAALLLEKGKTDFVAIGRALIVDPHWVEKVQNHKEETISQQLNQNEQHQAVIPTSLWKLILEVEGWFPIER
ncbi:2,4-dienoyl-CoA reductase-like NADH-dependent reductase (Old Yellow Enzyme family) [Neobacillus niacini]|uniref:NADH-dependent flavin oxidoreductase n=1 Tax=Neobacillus niacini TaxID=86668 RepID=UPI00285BD0E4|nr:NADH-dependent flavin oxidoreductase [Neobacillus niacini]MDR7075776.1 2,4-dienoyl-CoA reductase-like NADH-dependent reductase (Old Yellow Enzyme family) [Neobacillus niacini]